MRRLVYFLLALTLISGLAFTACSESAQTPSAPAATPTIAVSQPAGGSLPTQAVAQQSGTPRYGGILKQIHSLMVVNIGYIPDSAEPYDTWIAECDLEPLLAIQPDGSYGPCLATSYEVAPDYMSVVFHLRKGVKFHDGADFNAQAVKKNLDLYNTGKLDSLRFVSSVDVVDDYTVKVNFSQTQSGFLLPFATRPGEMESPKALDEHPKEWFLQNTVGTGPFQISEYVRDIRIGYKKFPGYWQQGKPYLDGIEWMFIADKTTSLMSYKAGEAHVLVYPSEKDRPDLEKAGVRIDKIFGPVFTCLMDGGNPNSPFSNLKVRQAVAHAIDRPGMAEGLGYGYWVPLQQFSYEGRWGYNPDIKGYPYDVAKAKQLLAEAGYPNGFKTTIYGAGTTGYNELLQANLAEIGITAEISLGTMANVAEWRQKGWTNGLSITPAGGPQPYKDSRVGLAIFSSKSGSYPNIFHSQDIDDLIAASDLELDSDKKQAIYRELNKLVTDNYCVAIPLFQNPGTLAISADVGYWNFQNAQSAKFASEDAWLKK